MSSELARIGLLRRVLEAGARSSDVQVGIGDDAAVLGPAPGLVWTVDAQVEGTHFRADWMSWQDVGYRSVMAAASDLAAMAAEPFAALASLVLSQAIDDRALEAIAEGQATASRELGLPIVGGNLARGTETSLTTTVLGRASAPLLRTGARVGDVVWVAGELGMAAAGLALLAAGKAPEDAAAEACLAAFRRPRARLGAGRALEGRASAAIDVSDGLSGDAAHLGRASHVTIVLSAPLLANAIPPQLAAVADRLARAPLDLVLGGGEDYAVLACAPAVEDLEGAGFTRIGRCAEAGPAPVALETETGITPIAASGFDHFG